MTVSKATRVGLMALMAFQSTSLFAGTTISATNQFAYGANIGWINARGDVTNGAVIGQSYCTGYVWSANCGWIGLGNGPTNGWHYGNTSANDWGVNHDGAGHLSGYAYGANIGWITFEQTYGQPHIDLLTGHLEGAIWGANVGWISLSNSQAFVSTDSLAPGADTDADGMPDWWEYKMAGDLTTLSGSGHDEDSDQVPDAQEYGADTDPLDEASRLAMIAMEQQAATNRLTWTVEPTRFYRVEQSAGMTNNSAWADSGLGQMPPDPAATMTRDVPAPDQTSLFYRAKAVVPLP